MTLPTRSSGTALSVKVLVLSVAVLGLHSLVGEADAQRGLDIEEDTLTKTVLIHPVFEGEVHTREHTYNSNLRLGDQLARDFMALKVGDDGIPRAYKPGTNGERNEDWYGWREDVFAPFDGRVVRVERPDTTNTPGVMNREAQPGLIFFENDEGVTVLYAHVREIAVGEDQRIEAGEVVAKVGNNGNSRAPHVHVGAWQRETPLQIQVDLYAEERPGARLD